MLCASSVVLLILLERVRGLHCAHRYHGVSIGSNKTTFAQVWLYQMCQRMAQGIADLIRPGSYHVANAYLGNPNLLELPDGRFSGVHPRGHPPRFRRGIVFDCPGCQDRLLAEHLVHTTNWQPLLLRPHFDNEADNYDCPMCTSHI